MITLMDGLWAIHHNCWQEHGLAMMILSSICQSMGPVAAAIWQCRSGPTLCKKFMLINPLELIRRATFQKPVELNNNPIYADQNFAALSQEGQGIDSADVQGNGNADDYAAPTDVPVESDFTQPALEKQRQKKRQNQLDLKIICLPLLLTSNEPAKKPKNVMPKPGATNNDY